MSIRTHSSYPGKVGIVTLLEPQIGKLVVPVRDTPKMHMFLLSVVVVQVPKGSPMLWVVQSNQSQLLNLGMDI